MSTYKHEEFVFTALANFRANKDPEAQLDSAKEFGIRIVYNNGIQESDYRVVEGPYLRFRRKARWLLMGVDDDCSFFIRRVEATKDSSTKLYYYDLKTGRDAIIEIFRRPGLHLTFRSGQSGDVHLDVDMMCTQDYHLCFLSCGDRFDVE